MLEKRFAYSCGFPVLTLAKATFWRKVLVPPWYH